MIARQTWMVLVLCGCMSSSAGSETQVWGAIAAYVETTSDGCTVGSSSSWNYTTHSGAANEAMRLCSLKSSRCADAVVWQGKGVCGAVATAAWNESGGGARCAYGSARGSYNGASRVAMEGCQSEGGGSNCTVTAVHCNSD